MILLCDIFLHGFLRDGMYPPATLLSERHFNLFAGTVVGIILLVAGAVKLVQPRDFVEVVRGYELLPAGMSRPIAQLLPVAEVLIGVGLLLDRSRPWSAVAASSLFMVFGVAVAINILRDRRNIACGCFGSQLEDEHLSWSIVVRNAVLAGLAATIALGYFGVASTSVFSADGSRQLSMEETVGTVLVAGAVIILSFLWRVVLMLRRLPDLEPCGGCS